jgi:hypothetical protein
VDGSTLAISPHGQASIATVKIFIVRSIDHLIMAGIARATGNAVGIKVETIGETTGELIPASDKALEAVKSGRQALLDMWLPKF